MIPWQLNSYALAMFVTAAISAALALYIWRQRPAAGATPFALCMAGIAEWSFGYALELGSPELAAKLFWTSFNFVGIVTVPVAFLIFALQYTHRERWLTRRNLVLLLSIPIATLLLAWTNDWHHLIRSAERLDTSGPIPMFDPTYSTAFWVYWVYTALALLAASGLMLHTAATSPGLYRRQSAALLLGAIVPWLGNVLYLSGASPFHKLDLTPFAFTIAGLIVTWGLYRFRLFDIVPVAREAVIESMQDGVLTLDAQARVVDINPAAERIVGCSAAQAIGQPASRILGMWPALTPYYGADAAARAEIVLEQAEARRYFDLNLSPLHDRRGRLSGQLVVFRDVTERKKTEQALRAYQQQLEASYEREQDKRRLSDTLREVAKIVSNSLAQQKVLDLILAQLENVITYQRATVMLLAGDKLSIVAERDQQGGLVARQTFAADKYALNRAVLQSKQPLLLQDVTRDERWQATGSMAAIRSFINAPLLVNNVPIGILSVGRSDATPYTEEDAQTVFAFANQVAVALEQARLHEFQVRQFERDLEIAQQIQTSLLPTAAPQVRGLDIVGLSRPARHVGGDFYNYFVFDEGRVGVAVGDVSDKGMQAALMMALSFGLLITNVRRDIAPAELLASLNLQVRPHTLRNHLNTAMAYLTLETNPQGWNLKVSNAGLIAPLVRHGDGRVEWLNVGGTPLGTVANTRYEEISRTLQPGDVLVVSSDGILEAMNKSRELYSFVRLVACLANAPRGTAEQIKEHILADMRAFAGGVEPHDDVTLVVIVID